MSLPFVTFVKYDLTPFVAYIQLSLFFIGNKLDNNFPKEQEQVLRETF